MGNENQGFIGPENDLLLKDIAKVIAKWQHQGHAIAVIASFPVGENHRVNAVGMTSHMKYLPTVEKLLIMQSMTTTLAESEGREVEDQELRVAHVHCKL